MSTTKSKPASTTPSTTAKSSSPAETKTPVKHAGDSSVPTKPAAAETKKAAAAETKKAAVVDANGKKVVKKAKKPRQQISAVLDIDISQARCATHLKRNLTDVAIEADIKERRKRLKEAKANKEDEEVVKGLKDDLDKAVKGQLRVSSTAPVAAATVCDFFIKEIISHGLDQAIAADCKLLTVEHLHTGPVTELVTWPLFRKVDVFANYDPEKEDELRKKRAAANKKVKEAKEKKSASTKGVPVKKPVPPKEADEGSDEEAGGDGSKTTFITYVENAVKSIRKDEHYKNMRVSNRIREYGSDLVVGFLQRTASLTQLVVQDVLGARTLTDAHIRAVVQLLLVNEDRTAEEIAPLLEHISDKITTFKTHQSEEKKKKEASLTDEEKAKAAAKRAKTDIERKKKSLESANKAAAKAHTKAETLAKELASAPAAAESETAAEESETAAEESESATE